MGGSNVANQPGTYGTRGNSTTTNIPGARLGAVSWTDASGNFWLFGGFGIDGGGNQGFLNDLWKYSAGKWMWVNGSNLVDATGTYGTQGTASSSNVPGARRDAVSWTDASGNFWLFGGFGSSTTNAGNLNDLWKYNAGQWTWVNGADVANQSGIYGTQGTAAPGNVPGSRSNAAGWTDSDGNLWLFGGAPPMNDLWKYEP
jgi:hypothetical protein